jgi:(p)ppGpp synthase/HD superfamily hydrolase
MSNLSKAIAIAANGFLNKTDKAGEPYIMHCIRVMHRLHTDDNELKIIAILHDCVEDGVCSVEDLVNDGFSNRVIRAVSLLTHNKQHMSYMDYIKLLSCNSDARRVKLSDLKDNSDITRLKGLTKKDFDRMEKYHIAYTYLSKV